MEAIRMTLERVARRVASNPCAKIQIRVWVLGGVDLMSSFGWLNGVVD
jgi:hypothetical protein